jgi:hypothetical protein
MTQSKDDFEDMSSITLKLDDIIDTNDTITIDTSTFISDYTLTDSMDGMTVSVNNLSWDFGNKIDPDRVEKMCEHYPALRKAWENFQAIYKMVDQDYKGNIEPDDEIPF